MTESLGSEPCGTSSGAPDRAAQMEEGLLDHGVSRSAIDVVLGLLETGELDCSDGDAAVAVPSPPPEQPPDEAPTEELAEPEASEDQESSPPDSSGEEPRATLRARKLAADNNLDLRKVKERTGHAGADGLPRVTLKDVEKALAERSSAAAPMS